jgi:hypothetical protein
MYQYSLEEQVFIVKTCWIAGSIKNCQRMFVEKFWWQASTSHLSSRLTDNASGKLLIIFILSFRVANFLFENSQKAQPHFITGMKCECIALLFFL